MRWARGAVAAAVVVVGLAACHATDRPGGIRAGDVARSGSTAIPGPTAAAPPSSTAAAAPADGPPPALVATAVHPPVDVFAAPGDAAPARAVDSPGGPAVPLVLLVLDRRGDWLDVALPVRPNGTSGWVRTADVTLASDPYKVTVRLAAHRVSVTKGATTVIDVPAGVGRAATPTPGGIYYIAELLRPPDPNGPYGPYAYGLNGFSDVLTSFNNGDGVIGLHGTDDPASVGTDVSHGCIRLRNEDIERLVPLLPLGTPVDIQP